MTKNPTPPASTPVSSSDPTQPLTSTLAPLVVVVDDDRAIREMLQVMLELEGYTVWTLDNGAHVAAALLAAARPCVVLLDLMMPLVSGWDVLHQMADDPRLCGHAVIAMTAGLLRGEKLPVGALALLAKPFDLDTLYRLVERYATALPAKLPNVATAAVPAVARRA